MSRDIFLGYAHDMQQVVGFVWTIKDYLYMTHEYTLRDIDAMIVTRGQGKKFLRTPITYYIFLRFNDGESRLHYELKHRDKLPRIGAKAHEKCPRVTLRDCGEFK